MRATEDKKNSVVKQTVIQEQAMTKAQIATTTENKNEE